MATKRYAKARARAKSRQAYRNLMKKPKKAVVKIASNFIGKATYKTAKKSKKRYSRRKRY